MQGGNACLQLGFVAAMEDHVEAVGAYNNGVSMLFHTMSLEQVEYWKVWDVQAGHETKQVYFGTWKSSSGNRLTLLSSSTYPKPMPSLAPVTSAQGGRPPWRYFLSDFIAKTGMLKMSLRSLASSQSSCDMKVRGKILGMLIIALFWHSSRVKRAG